MKVYRTDEIRNVVLLGHGAVVRQVLLRPWRMYQAQRIVWEK